MFDAPVICRLAGRWELADTTISIPHPYSIEQAREWIIVVSELFARGQCAVFGMQSKDDGSLVGTVGLREIDSEHLRAELGYWVAVESWGRGYATEASRAVLDYGFNQFGLNRIYAFHMLRNPPSGRVLTKIGMKQEGLLRQGIRKWGVFEDVVLMAKLRGDR
jgi:ribosomal-protein-alanine N-acetyltransferase